ncbi:hypothetical protein GCM10010377_05500 [Streptomyces viridiviolaceus]|uniref:Uncharacterized protein n=1 Tax=Streptomyces viridiviolaceus TaxID=68282 RepID=A0ABW2E152_9ACTN|nr:hypothetical protein [Streptomyces viridiviolaceus]GHB18657.1 hypothetical protein GCM10010377_05500 [Streptomyces viridiviolaceus]
MSRRARGAELRDGRLLELGCEFPFTVDGITPGSKFYAVEVSHRGGPTGTEDELCAGGPVFTLGG